MVGIVGGVPLAECGQAVKKALVQGLSACGQEMGHGHPQGPGVGLPAVGRPLEQLGQGLRLLPKGLVEPLCNSGDLILLFLLDQLVGPAKQQPDGHNPLLGGPGLVRHQVQAGLAQGLAKGGRRRKSPALDGDGRGKEEGILLIQGGGDPLELHRSAGKKGKADHLLAGEGKGKLLEARQELGPPPGIDGAGGAKGALPQQAVDAAAAVLVLEAAFAVRRMGQDGKAFFGGVLLFPPQGGGAEGVELRVADIAVLEVVLLIHIDPPGVAAVVGTGRPDAGKFPAENRPEDLDFFGSHNEVTFLCDSFLYNP